MLHKLLLYNVHARILKLGYLEKGFVVFGKIVFTAINQLDTLRAKKPFVIAQGSQIRPWKLLQFPLQM